MKLIIAGSRNIDKRIAFWEALKYLEPNAEFALNLIFNGKAVDEIVTGECPKGPDQVPHMLGGWWESGGYGCEFDIVPFPAEWERHGKPAGMIRNKQMAVYADELLLIWDGKSPGSKNMKAEMKKLGKPVTEIITEVTYNES